MKNYKLKLAAIFTALCCLMLVSCTDIHPQRFTCNEFSIELDTSFKATENEGAVGFLTSSRYTVICVKEDFSSIENGEMTTEEEYANSILSANPEYNAELKTANGLYYLEYENKAEYKNFYYNSYVFKTSGGFYTVHFATTSKKNNSQSNEYFAELAKTVSFDNQ